MDKLTSKLFAIKKPLMMKNPSIANLVLKNFLIGKKNSTALNSMKCEMATVRAKTNLKKSKLLVLIFFKKINLN